MSVSIGSNVISLRIARRASEASQQERSALERLSSGQRINRASDDAAGLSISSRLGANARIFGQSIRNANDAISLMNIAQGSLTGLSNILTRMKELAMQASNGSFSTTQRLSLDREAEELQREFNRITATTTFNGRQLFDTSLGRMVIQLGYSGSNGQLDTSLGEEVSRNVGTGRFTQLSSTAPTSSGNPTLVDANGDGHLDLIRGSYFDAPEIRYGNGDGTFSSTGITLNGYVAGNEVRTGDFNGDGIADIVVLGNDLSLSPGTEIYLGDGTSFNSVAIVSANASFFRTIGDSNNDGRDDLVFHDDTFGIQLGIRFNAQGGITTFATPTSVVREIKDYNGDGKADILAGAGASTRVFLGNGNTFSTTGQLVPGNMGLYLGTVDLDHDGILDIISADTGATIAVRKGRGDGTFEAARAFGGSSAATSGVLGDINNDGYMDIMATVGTETRVFLNQGDGTFDQGAQAAASSSIFTMGDLDEDGALDLLFVNGLTMLADEISSASIEKINLSTIATARASLAVIEDAFARVTSELSAIGAIQSRLETAAKNLQVMRENSLSAQSRIIDADVAQEAAELTRATILSRISASLLAQANAVPALALELLKN